MSEEQIERLKIECLEKELEYWTLKVETAKIDKEAHEMMNSFVAEHIEDIVNESLGLNKVNPQYIKELEKIQKEKGIGFESIEDFEKFFCGKMNETEGGKQLKGENSIEWAKRIDVDKDGTSFLEDEEFDEMLNLLLGTGRWKGIVNRWRKKGYSEFKIGYSVGELKKKVDKDYISLENLSESIKNCLDISDI